MRFFTAAWLIVLGATAVSCAKKAQRPARDETSNGLPTVFFDPSSATAKKGSGFCPQSSTAQAAEETSPRLSQAFLNNCSGCHGTAGEGKKGFPSLRGVSLERLKKIVRRGGSSMPFFGADLISDEDLEHDGALLSGDVELKPFATQNVPVAAHLSFDDDSYQEAMKAGLVAWRTPGERGACVSCHGPDGIDLARYDYPNSAILRRALGQDLPAEKAVAVVRMIAAQRWRYGIEQPCDAAAFSPLQPGGLVLKGASDLEKDAALAKALVTAKLDLGRDVQTAADAEAFLQQWQSLDPRTVPLAIELDRWTEDDFHGDEHRSTSEWIPEIPMEPKSEEAAKEWTALQNAYLEDPSDANLWKLIDGVTLLDGARFTKGGVSERIAREKYRAVLGMQHRMRFDTQNFPDLSATEDTNRFAVWETGQIANVMARGCADVGDANDPFPCWNYPQSFYKKMGTDRARLLTDVLQLNLTWLVAGWLDDPALRFTEGGEARITDLLEAGQHTLPLHDVYFSLATIMKGPDHGGGEALKRWTEDILPHLARLLEASRVPALTSEHRALVLQPVTTIHRALLLNAKAQGLVPQQEAILAIKKWHQDTNSADALVTNLIAE